MESEDQSEMFTFKPGKIIYLTETSIYAIALIDFLHDAKKTPELQLTENEKMAETEYDNHCIKERYYSTKLIADSFLLVAPILLYRVIERALKEFLLNMIKCNKFETKVNVMKANFKEIEESYKESPLNLDITKISRYETIDEIRILNNVLKHNNDTVTKQLHEKDPYWTLGETITAEKIESRIANFESGIVEFFLDFEERRNKKNK